MASSVQPPPIFLACIFISVRNAVTSVLEDLIDLYITAALSVTLCGIMHVIKLTFSNEKG